MGKINLLLLDNDIDYITCLGNYIAVNYSYLFTVSYMTGEKLSRNKKLPKNGFPGGVDILLLDRELQKDININSNSVIYLSENRTGNEENAVYKYQHCDLIVKKIIDCSASKDIDIKDTGGGGRKSFCLGIYSPVPTSFCVSLGIGISVRCSLKNKKVLFFDTDGLSSTSTFFNSSSVDFSNVLYRLKESTANIGMVLDGIVCASILSGLFFLPQAESLLELDEITPTDYARLISSLKSLESYDLIVINMDSRMDIRNFSLMGECNSIFTPFTADTAALGRLMQFRKENDLQKCKKGVDLLEKITPLQIEGDDSYPAYHIESVLEKNTGELIPPGIGKMNGLECFTNELSEETRFLDSLIDRYVFTKKGGTKIG